MAKNNKIQLFRTETSGSTTTSIEKGELALNINSSSPFIMFKDTSGTVQKLGSLSTSTGSSVFHTMTQKAITDALTTRKSETDILATSLTNEIAARKAVDGQTGQTYAANTSANYIYNATSLNDADLKLDSALKTNVTIPTNYDIVYPTSDKTGGVVFNNTVANDTVLESLEKVDGNVALLVQEVLNDEEVTAAAITEIKDSVGLDENLKYVADSSANYISEATTFSEADSLLDAALKEVSSQTYGGYIYIEQFDKVNFQNALTLALESLSEGESAILVCTYFKGKHTITEGFNINNPVSLIFGGIDVEFNNSVGKNLFTFNSNNISIQGINRNTDKTQTDNGATVFRMLNVDNSLEGYHIKSRGNKNLEIKNITLVGLRTTMGHQYGNASYDIDGVGGIYIEKSKPEVVEGSNTCNNVRIENILIAGSKAHGIYLDTPILSSIKNVRLSDCGGHGVFINGGTSILFENTYVSSSDMAGFCIYGSSYVSLNNCVAENGGIGFWIRSSFNVTMTSPGVEATKNHGANPWRYSQPITNKYGLNLSTLSSDGSTSISIPDVNSDASSYFRGYGILISGGKSINIFTPYIKSISQPATNAGYPNGAENTANVKYINVIGDARSVYISNPSFKEMDNSTIPTLIKHEIGIEENVINLELIYNTEQTTLKGTLDNQYYVTDNNKRAPIYCKSTSTVLRNGDFLLTNYRANNPTNELELANKQYVDIVGEKVNNVISGSGLNSDGTFKVPTTAQTSGYTTAATSLMDAIIILDNQVEENETVAAYALTDLNNRLLEQQNEIDELENKLSYYSGHNTISSLTSLPITKRLCVATISSSQTLGISGTLVDGKEIHILIKNNSTETITISIPNTFVNMIGENLEIDGNRYGEINLVSDGTNIYYRGAS